MITSSSRVAIIGGLRIPFAKSFTVYNDETNQGMLTFVMRKLVEKYGLKGERLGDVAAGAVMTHSSDWNLTRETVLSSGLSPHTPGFNVQRACGTSLDTVNLIGLKIASGQISIGIAGGTDTNSDLPVVFKKSFAKRLVKAGRARSLGERLGAFAGFSPSDLKPVLPGVLEPRTGMSMGQHTEVMAKRWKIAREDQDALAYTSHMNGARAYKQGFYDDLVLEFQGIKRDTNLREDTSLEKLAKLKPAFDPTPTGTLTAGNSTPLTDGAAAVLLASENEAKKRGLPVLAYIRDVEVAAVDYVTGEEGLLMAPAFAVARLLQRNNLKLQDFDIYEIHEAFEAQVLCTFAAWESPEFCREKLGLSAPLGSIDRAKLNLNGGSVALGHPFAATGARIVASIAKALKLRGGGRGLISICTAGGMGVTAIIESEG
jgi:acetyl-CoA C-acetyltransferase